MHGGGGAGGAKFGAKLNFPATDYAHEVDELRRMSQEDLIQVLLPSFCTYSSAHGLVSLKRNKTCYCASHSISPLPFLPPSPAQKSLQLLDRKSVV